MTYAWISNSRCIGENNAKKLGLSMKNIHVVYRGRDSQSFPCWQQPRLSVFRFVCIGRLYEKKGYPELLEAFAQVHKIYPHTELEIYGEGSYRSEMEKSIQSLQMTSHIHLKGNVPGAWKKLYESHCFVFPSRFEGFSGALVEAMMTGIPIISSDIPMNMEAVAHKKTALVHQLKNANDLADKMKTMVSNYAEMMEMGNRAREESFARFDIRVIAGQYEQLLRRFLAEKK
jgi:glycosyltransferase involved in cell wall biosynthesis